MKKIVIDIYGADAGEMTVINGVVKAFKSGMDFFPVMVGDSALVTRIFEENGIGSDRYETLHTTDFITADEAPSAVFRGRDESSVVMGLLKLKNDPDCTALLSPGCTGALLVGSICRLGLNKGIKYPALASALPCSDLVNFARMGNVFCKCFCGIENPRVGLMSVGREKGKGSTLTTEAYGRIEELGLNFIGNLEGSDMVSEYADVIVTDGFSGNLLLKCTEASGKAALAAIEELSLDEDTMQRIREVLIKKFDFNSRGAATFLGTVKTVVKMHGIADEDTVVASIDQIIRLEKAGFSQYIAEEMNK